MEGKLISDYFESKFCGVHIGIFIVNKMKSFLVKGFYLDFVKRLSVSEEQ